MNICNQLRFADQNLADFDIKQI